MLLKLHSFISSIFSPNLMIFKYTKVENLNHPFILQAIVMIFGDFFSPQKKEIFDRLLIFKHIFHNVTKNR
jgi:hypothetical protein